MFNLLRNIGRVIFGPSAPQPRPPEPEPIPPIMAGEDHWQHRLLAEHNRVRAARGLSPLRSHPTLQAIANLHAAEMARRNRLTHQGADGSWPWHRAQRHGYPSGDVSENVAWNYPDARSVVDGWVGSPGHRLNVFGHRLDFGGAKVGPYWCAVYGRA